MKTIKQIFLNLCCRTSLLWILPAIFFFYFTGGDRPLEISLWLTPIFLIRFCRENKFYAILIFLLPAIIFETLVVQGGINVLPRNLFIIFTIVKSSFFLLPYLLDKILYRFIPLKLRSLLLPSAVITVEYFLMSKFSGGTWGNPGYGIENIELLQLASIAGIWGIVFIVYWTAAIMNELVEFRFSVKKIRTVGLIYLGIVLLAYGFGSVRLKNRDTNSAMLKVATVSPGVNHRKDMYKIIGRVFASKRTGSIDIQKMKQTIEIKNMQLISETQKAAKTGAAFVAWPEGASFIFESDEEKYVNKMIASAKTDGFSLAIGLMVIKDDCVELVKNNKPFIYNKLILVTPQAGIAFEYYKHHLAPGWERMMTVPNDNSMPLYRSKHGNISGAICYDMDFPNYIKQSGSMRSDLLIAPANDWPEVKHLHYLMARMRSIENGVSVLRPSSNGISTMMDPYGHIISYVDDNRSGGAPMVAAIPMKSIRTLYPIVGDFVVWLSLGIGIFLIAFGFYLRFKKQGFRVITPYQ